MPRGVVAGSDQYAVGVQKVFDSGPGGEELRVAENLKFDPRSV